ncbi:hypothetical protein ACFL0W_00265 [Nanoarchaeota archaeon]
MNQIPFLYPIISINFPNIFSSFNRIKIDPLAFLSDDKREKLFEYGFIERYCKNKITLEEFRKQLKRFKSELVPKIINEKEFYILNRRLSEKEFNKIVNSLPKKLKKFAVLLRHRNLYKQDEALRGLGLAKYQKDSCAILVEQLLFIDVDNTDVDHVDYLCSMTIGSLFQLKSVESVSLVELFLHRTDYPLSQASAQNFLELLSDKTEHLKLYSKQRAEFFEQDRRGFRRSSATRKIFEKTGSDIILLGGNLAGKIIVRVISEKAFLAWKKAFEAEEAWKKAGFDYIPVEPIVRSPSSGELMAYKQKDESIKVYSKVLGRDLVSISEIQDVDKFMEYNKVREKIIRVLDDLKIFHGHLHSGNFCFDKEGKKLYVIDFDQAISPGRKNVWQSWR